MTLTQRISNLFSKTSTLLKQELFGISWGDWTISCLPFADAIFLNITDKVTDLCNDVTFTLKAGDAAVFTEFKAFFEVWGQVILNEVYERGYVVIMYKKGGTFKIGRESDDYTVDSTIKGSLIVKPTKNEEGLSLYVMRSTTYKMKGKSDRKICEPFLQFLDNTLNASSTATERLGVLCVMSPESQQGLPTQTVLTETQRKELEDKTQEQYGSLSKQKQLMLLPRTMRLATINLAGLDQRTYEKAKLCILAVCDRIKVPANQVAIVDADSSKALANGGELLEGDFAKYQTFERLLQATFVQMASDAGLQVDYQIYNKPMREIHTAQ